MIPKSEVLLLLLFAATQVVAVDRNPFDYVRHRLSYLNNSMNVDLYSTRWVASIMQGLPFNPTEIKEMLSKVHHDATLENLSEAERRTLVSTKYRSLSSSLDAANALMGELLELANANYESRCSFEQIKHILTALDSLFGLMWRVNNKNRGELLLPDKPKPMVSFSNIYDYVRCHLAFYASLCASKVGPEFDKYLGGQRQAERFMDSMMHHSGQPSQGLQLTLEADEANYNRAQRVDNLGTLPMNWIYGLYSQELQERIRLSHKQLMSDEAIRSNCLALIEATETCVGAFEVVSLVSPQMTSFVLTEELRAQRKITFLKLREYSRLCYGWLAIDASRFSSMPGFTRLVRDAESSSSGSRSGSKGLFSLKH